MLPLALVSAQAVALQRDLDLTRSRLGIAVATCFAASALTAAPLGHLVGRIGPSAGLRMSAGFSLVALAAVGALATRWWHVALALVACGLANAGAQVAANLALAGGVPSGRQGLAFGVKQAAIPAASLLAGLSLPVIAVVAGWRAAFLAAAVVMAAGVAYRPGLAGAKPAASGRRRRGPSRLLVLLALVGLLASGVGNAVPAFAVDAAVSRGIGEAGAGLVLAAGGVMAIVGRLVGGWTADRRASAGLDELATLIGAGVVAFAVLVAFGQSRILFVVGVLAAFAAAWGWPGLLFYATVRSHPANAGPASGLVLSWAHAGNVLGPLAVGFIAQHGSYRQAWLASALALVAATAAALLAAQIERRAGPPP